MNKKYYYDKVMEEMERISKIYNKKWNEKQIIKHLRKHLIFFYITNNTNLVTYPFLINKDNLTLKDIETIMLEHFTKRGLKYFYFF